MISEMKMSVKLCFGPCFEIKYKVRSNAVFLSEQENTSSEVLPKTCTSKYNEQVMTV